MLDYMALFRSRAGAGVHQALASLQEASDWSVLELQCPQIPHGDTGTMSVPGRGLEWHCGSQGAG